MPSSWQHPPGTARVPGGAAVRPWQADGMCGRYAASRDAAALVEVLADLGVVVTDVTAEARGVTPSHNVAPTTVNHVVTGIAPDAGREDCAQVSADGAEPGGDGAGDPGARLAGLSWGLVPSWAKDRRGAARMINARIESVADRSAYKSLLGRRRCLVPADGWFEWQRRPDGKQPFFVRPGEEPLVLFAGLYSWWREPAGTPDPATGSVPWFGSYTILTGPARPDLAWLHDRMPVAVAPRLWQDWLSRDGGQDPRHLLAELRADLADPATQGLRWYPVDRRVGSVANDDPSLVAPLVESPGDR
jgi:putative SOS response-associated peptidase YedK